MAGTFRFSTIIFIHTAFKVCLCSINVSENYIGRYNLLTISSVHHNCWIGIGSLNRTYIGLIYVGLV